jgi:hypothetical protein
MTSQRHLRNSVVKQSLSSLCRTVAATAVWSWFAAAPAAAQTSSPPGTGLPWPGRTLTISFPNDGTPVGRSLNQLSDRLAHLDEMARRSEILQAFQAWSQVANVDFALARDGQQPLGTVGLSQGDPRFGDIRLVAVPLDRAIANAVPFSPTGGSWAGDILLNSQVQFSLRSATANRSVDVLSPSTWLSPLQPVVTEAQSTFNAAYREFLPPSAQSGSSSSQPAEADLWTVVLHEAGNALGLPDNNDPTSIMYAAYTGPRSALATSDIQSIRNLYGPRPADRFEVPSGANNARRSATTIRANSQSVQTVDGELMAGDTDWYRYSPPSGETRAVFRLKAAGLSLLLGRLQGYDSAGKELFTLETEDFHGRQDLAIDLSSFTPGRPLFFRVSMTSKLVTGHPFGVGRYQLEIDRRRDASATVDPSPFEPLGDDEEWMHSSALNLDELLAANPALLNEATPNESLSTATSLTTTPGFPSNSRFEVLAAMNASQDRDVYRWARTPGDNRQFVVTVDPVGEDVPDLLFAAYDDQGRFLPATLSRTASGSYQLGIAPTKQSPFVALAITRAESSSSVLLPYTLVIDRIRPNVPADGLQAGSLTEATRYFGAKWTVSAAQLFRFDLTADVTAGPAEDAGVQFVLFDSQLEMPVSMAVIAGADAQAYALIQPGDYDVRIFGLTPRLDTALPEVAYRLTWVAISDDVGPLPINPTYPPFHHNPAFFPPPPPPPPVAIVPWIPMPPAPVPVPIPAAHPWSAFNMNLYYNFLPPPAPRP